MLGSSIKSELSQSDSQLFFTIRSVDTKSGSNEYELDLFKDDLRTWFGNKPKFDYVVNCIGAIPQKYVGKPELEIRQMIELNSFLPELLNEQSELRGFRTIQIATDCVFSGESGSYTEKSVHDAKDIYGVSKSVGEKYSAGAMLLRCSIIGTNDPTNVSLHNWLLTNKKNSLVNGYKNHNWNGITTVAFARIVRGIIEGNIFSPGLQHIMPSDKVTKCELLQLIADANSRKDLQIAPVDHEMTIDRTLTSLNPERNELLWATGGYKHVPLISELVREMNS
jgi:dTDP-4-dehydrorhamnose reductase